MKMNATLMPAFSIWIMFFISRTSSGFSITNRNKLKEPYFPNSDTYLSLSHGHDLDYPLSSDAYNNINYLPLRSSFLVDRKALSNQNNHQIDFADPLFYEPNMADDYESDSHQQYETEKRRNLERLLARALEYVEIMEQGDGARGGVRGNTLPVNLEDVSTDLLPASSKRDAAAGSNICIWKVCPPSPWRRSKTEETP